jgi:hypothetical protein
LILIDDLHRHEAPGTRWQGNCHWPGIEVEDGERVQRVAVGPDDAALVCTSELVEVQEFPKGAVFDEPGKVDIGLGAIIVFDGDKRRRAGNLSIRNGTRRGQPQGSPDSGGCSS